MRRKSLLLTLFWGVFMHFAKRAYELAGERVQADVGTIEAITSTATVALMDVGQHQLWVTTFGAKFAGLVNCEVGAQKRTAVSVGFAIHPPPCI